MGELVAEVKALIVHRKCDKCGAGIMEPSGNVLMSNPPLYPHKCNNCGYTENYVQTYPYQKLVPVENL